MTKMKKKNIFVISLLIFIVFSMGYGLFQKVDTLYGNQENLKSNLDILPNGEPYKYWQDDGIPVSTAINSQNETLICRTQHAN